MSTEATLIGGRDRKEYDKEYRENNKDRLNAWHREYYHNNKELMAAKSKARNQETRLAYKQAMQANKSARKAGKTGTLTEAEWVELKASYSNRCAYCGTSSFKITLDHFEPLSGVGTNDIGNIVPACILCNFAKSNKPFIVFLGWKNGAFN